MNETEQKISERISELEEMKAEAIVQLKIQEELILRPFDVAIAELSAFLPIEIKIQEAKQEPEAPPVKGELPLQNKGELPLQSKGKLPKDIPVDLLNLNKK